MKILKALLLSGLLFLVVSPKQVFGDCPKNACENIGDPAQKVTCLEEVTQKCASQRVDLTSQIAYMDAQIRLTTSKIAGTEIKIAQLAQEIDALSNKIDRLEGSLADLSNVLIERIVATYKQGDIEPFFLLLSSNGFSDFLTKFKYIKIVQAHDKRLMFQMQETKDNYTDQKTLREQKKQEQEKLRIQLTQQKKDLDNQKAAKDDLLRTTRSDESKYQQLLAQARAEFEAIQNILAGQGQETQIGHVDGGAKIASIISGSSCNSSGEHLHFIVAENGNTHNPFNYLKSGIDYDNCTGPGSCSAADTFNPSGSWDWPISARIKFLQGYGLTWAIQNTWVGSIYNFHNGIDIDSGSSLDVKAVKSGNLFRGAYTGGGGCALRYVRVHNDDGGLDTYYLHVNYVL